MRRYRLGLVVGKFSPLHLGHEHLIAQALSACDQVVVVGYSQPEFPGCERERREAWVARRFPQVINLQLNDQAVLTRCSERSIAWRAMPPNTAPDAEQQDWFVWLLDGPLRLRPDAMFASEAYVHPTCERLSRQWGRVVTPVCVDPRRLTRPVSATQIRQNLYAHREHLHPDVYRDFVRRVVLLGGESSGKTTLAQALATALGTAWVPEYGRERWLDRDGQLTLQDLLDIGRIQVEREEAMVAQANGVLFCDTSPLTTLGYAGWMFGARPEGLEVLAQRAYDLVVLCEPDFAFVQDGTRQLPGFRTTQQAWYEQQLATRSEPVLRVRGSVSERVAQVRIALSDLWSMSITPPQEAT
jgi:HTH-type transcriptional regulator, transcriptional repressor of NAD biosynthesis genes